MVAILEQPFGIQNAAEQRFRFEVVARLTGGVEQAIGRPWLLQMPCSSVFLPHSVRPISRPRPALAAMPVAVGCAFRSVASILTIFCPLRVAASPAIIRAKKPFSLQRFERL